MSDNNDNATIANVVRNACIALCFVALVMAACTVDNIREIGRLRGLCLEAGHSVLECQQVTR